MGERTLEESGSAVAARFQNEHERRVGQGDTGGHTRLYLLPDAQRANPKFRSHRRRCVAPGDEQPVLPGLLHDHGDYLGDGV